LYNHVQKRHVQEKRVQEKGATSFRGAAKAVGTPTKVKIRRAVSGPITRLVTLLVTLLANALPAFSADGLHGLQVERLDPGSVTREDGLAAWGRIYAVVSHPRCANCHTDDENTPMWTTEGESQIHGMHINAGESRRGEEFLPCVTCHATSTLPNVTPHAPPHAGMPWQLAPVEFLWFGKSSATICAQLRDPRTNGNRDGDGLVEHILHDRSLQGFITWAFDPGGDREPAPGTLQEHLDDTIAWVAAGMPCPPEE